MKTIIYNQRFDIFNIFLIKYKSRVWFQFEATQRKGSDEFSVDLVRNSTFSSRCFNYSCISSLFSSYIQRNSNWEFCKKHELRFLWETWIVIVFSSHTILMYMHLGFLDLFLMWVSVSFILKDSTYNTYDCSIYL